jgi:hypothetical protein
VKRLSTVVFFILLLFTCINIHSCSKGGGSTPTNPCTGITISVSGSFTNPSAPGISDGSISATAAGSSGFTFNINGGAFQPSGNFTHLAAGSYMVEARNGDGCTGSAAFVLTGPNLCTGVTINVSSATTNNTPCQAPNGSITVTATGGTGVFTYNINGGAFQGSNVFTGLNGGVSYLITAKDANGCTGSASVMVNNAAAGPLFSAVKTLIQNNCAISNCHGDIQSPLFTNDCTIISNGPLIKQRAVDGNPSPMPPTGLLSASERQKITNWINAGGQFNN